MVYVDVVSGFLGAGKTTLVNEMLRSYKKKGIKTVYLVNEFGDVSVDANTINDRGFCVVELTGGCVCCNLRAGLSSVFLEIANKYRPKRIIFEPSGVFVFDDFLKLFEKAPLKDVMCLGKTISVVDAKNFGELKPEILRFVFNHIKNSSTAVLSKLSESKQDVEKLSSELRLINEGICVIAKPFSDINFEEISDDKNAYKNLKEKHQKMEYCTLVPKKSFNEESLFNFVNMLKNEDFGEVLRAKGYILYNQSPYLFNYSMGSFTLDKARKNQSICVSIIGIKLKKRELRKLCL